jgi:hypothetical protein
MIRLAGTMPVSPFDWLSDLNDEIAIVDSDLRASVYQERATGTGVGMKMAVGYNR